MTTTSTRPAKATRFLIESGSEWVVTSVRKANWDGRTYVHATPAFAYDAGSRTGLSSWELGEWLALTAPAAETATVTPEPTTEEPTVTPTSASSISATLRKAGFNPVSPADHSREGLKVREGRGYVRVTADLDSDQAAVRMIEDAHATLVRAGYDVAPVEGHAIYVSGKVTETPARDDDYTPEALDRDQAEELAVAAEEATQIASRPVPDVREVEAANYDAESQWRRVDELELELANAKAVARELAHRAATLNAELGGTTPPEPGEDVSGRLQG